MQWDTRRSVQLDTWKYSKDIQQQPQQWKLQRITGIILRNVSLLTLVIRVQHRAPAHETEWCSMLTTVALQQLDWEGNKCVFLLSFIVCIEKD